MKKTACDNWSYLRRRVDINLRIRHCGRVVKALDSKSNGVTRAGSNPANVVLFLPPIISIPLNSN